MNGKIQNLVFGSFTEVPYTLLKTTEKSIKRTVLLLKGIRFLSSLIESNKILKNNYSIH